MLTALVKTQDVVDLTAMESILLSQKLLFNLIAFISI